MSIDRETGGDSVDKLDTRIRRAIQEEVRRERSRRVVSEAVSEHRAAIRRGRSLLTANTLLMESLGRQVLLHEAIAEKGEDRGDEGLFGSSLRVFVDSFLGSVIEPAVNRILDTLGVRVGTRAHGVMRRIISNTFEGLVDEVLAGKRSLSDLWSCEVVSQKLAEGTAESLPEAIFDTFVGGGKSPTGVMRTLREAIAEYFKSADVVQRITEGFRDILCETDLVELLRGGAQKIQSVGIAQ